MESLIFLTEKKNRTIKARTCANSTTQQKYTGQDEATSPTALTKSHLITAVINAKQNWDVITADIPNAFVQMEKQMQNNKRTIMKIWGTLVNMLVNRVPQDYQNFVLHKGKHKIIYVEMKKALYRMLQS